VVLTSVSVCVYLASSNRACNVLDQAAMQRLCPDFLLHDGAHLFTCAPDDRPGSH
jgi:hypothetical protein